MLNLFLFETKDDIISQVKHGTQKGTHLQTCVPVPFAVFEKRLRSCLRSGKRSEIQELAFLECVPLIDWLWAIWDTLNQVRWTWNWKFIIKNIYPEHFLFYEKKSLFCNFLSLLSKNKSILWQISPKLVSGQIISIYSQKLIKNQFQV